MPVRFDDKLASNLERLIPMEEFDEDVDFKDAVKAAYRTDTIIGSIIFRESGLPDNVVDNPDFNPFEQLTEDEKLDSVFVENAALADTPEELEAVRRQTRKEREQRKVLEDAGALAVPAQLFTGIVDPINLIPVGGTAYRSYKTGSNILHGAMATGTVSGAVSALEESALHYTQLERTFGESSVNVSAATLLGGVLGGFSGGLASVKMNQVSEEVMDSMNVEPKIREGLDSVGAARFSEDVEIKGKAAKVLAKSFAFDPLTRTLSSEAGPTRRIANALAENPYEMDGGITQAVESFVKIHDGKYVSALEGHLAEFKSINQELTEGSAVARVFGKKGMRRKEFNEAVAREIRNPSDDALPQVKRAAESWRKNLYEPLKDELIAQKMLPEDVDVTTAANYLNRLWNPQKIAAKQDRFVNVVSKWLADEDAKLFARGDSLKAELKSINADIDKLRAAGKRADKAQLKRLEEIEAELGKIEFKKDLDLEEFDYKHVARQIAQRIKGTPDGRLPYDWKLGEGSKGFNVNGTSVRGPLKSRTFNIPDELVEEFLENDVEILGARYLRHIAADLELQKNFSDIEMKAELKEIDDWYSEKMESAKTEKERLKWEKKKNRDVKDIAAMRDRIRGVYGEVDHNNPWVRAARSTRDLNYLRFMGGVVASSIMDTARTFMSEGFANTLKHGLRPLVTKSKGFKVAAAEAKRYGVGVDVLMGGRSEIIADVADYTAGGTAVERGLRAAANKFGKVNLMDYWTAGMKQLHAVTMQNTVIDELLKGKINKKLKRLGIDDANAKNIAKQLQKHAKKVDGVWISNAKNWDSPDLEQMWGSAIRKESDRVIVIPGQEKPLFMSSELGKTIMQFKSFMFSATQRMLIAGIQGQEANYFGGMVMLVSMGMMSYAFKQWDAGRPISDDPKVWITEGIDRSGALGAIMEVNNTLEKISNNNMGLRPLIGASQPASRYASRSQAEALLGPTFGSFLYTTLRVVGAGTDANEWKESDTRALRRLLPYQNLMFVRQGFDKIEESLQ